MTRTEWTEKYKSSFGHDRPEAAEAQARGERKKKKKKRAAPPMGRLDDECPQCSRAMTPGALRCARCATNGITSSTPSGNRLTAPEK